MHQITTWEIIYAIPGGTDENAIWGWIQRQEIEFLQINPVVIQCISVVLPVIRSEIYDSLQVCFVDLLLSVR